MTKVEIDGKTYCVETLIHEVERLKKEVKAGIEIYRFTLNKIQNEIEELPEDMGIIADIHTGEIVGKYISSIKVKHIIDKYKGIYG